jgi:hypothetical protein
VPDTPGKYYYLNDQQIALIQQIADIVRDRFPNTRLRGKNLLDNKQNWFTPETYIALPPTNGIPAISQATGGTPQEGDKPGSAKCNIYRLVNGAISAWGYQEKVYNLTSNNIPQQWILVTKTKDGTWICPVGGGSSLFIGKANQHLFQGSAGFVQRYSGATSSSLSGTGILDLVYSRFGDVVNGAWVAYSQQSWGFEAIQTACPTGTGS